MKIPKSSWPACPLFSGSPKLAQRDELRIWDQTTRIELSKLASEPVTVKLAHLGEDIAAAILRQKQFSSSRTSGDLIRDRR